MHEDDLDCDSCEMLARRVAALEAENARLRKAAYDAAQSLDQMAHDEVEYGCIPRGGDCGLIARRLRAALAGEVPR